MDNREIVIRIIGETEGSGATKIQKKSADNTQISAFSSSSTKSSSSGVSKSVSNTAYTLAAYAASQAISQATSEILQLGSVYFSMAEDYKGQENLQKVTAVISQANSLFSSIMSGATIGSAAGPVGTAIGAAIGATVYAVKTAVNAKNIQYQQNLQLTSLGTANAFARTRAGFDDNSRGTEN
jgi:hypothetical protein